MDYKIISAYLDINSTLSYSQLKDRAPLISLKGNILLKNIDVTDKENNRLVKLPAFDVTVADSDLLLSRIHFSKILLNAPDLNVVRDASGRINLQSLIPEQEETKISEKDNDKAPLVIEADEIGIAQGKVYFSDFFNDKDFKTTLEQIDFKVEHFSNIKDSKSAVSLALQTDSQETVTLAGDFTLDPLSSDGAFEVKQIRVKKYSPYYRENILFDIEDAVLDLSTQYGFKKSGDAAGVKLSALAATLNSLRLRKKEEDKDFLSVPATSIKDTDIDLTKRVIMVGEISTNKGVLNIRRMNGGGEEFGYLEFDYGSYDITADGAKKLDTLIKVLHDRPALKLEIEGFVDPEKDREGLIQNLFHKKIKSQKLKDMVKKGQPAVSIDEVTLQPDDYRRYLKMAYKEEKFPKPRNIIGMAKDLPVPEMEKLMLTHIEVKDDDLRQLASQRSPR